jgi:type I restriction enzyme R subunit
MVDKKSFSERDICAKYIIPTITATGWDLNSQIREEVSFAKGRINLRGKLHPRGEQKRADYILYCKSNIPLAVIEAKSNGHSVALVSSEGFIMPKFRTYPSCFLILHSVTDY